MRELLFASASPLIANAADFSEDVLSWQYLNLGSDDLPYEVCTGDAVRDCGFVGRRFTDLLIYTLSS